MSSPSNVPDAGVRVLPQGQLDATVAQELAAQSFAEITHLPTGIASGRTDTVTVPPGGAVARQFAGSTPTLLHVVAGQVSVLWGHEFRQTARAVPGDTVLVPAGIGFQARNDSPVDTLQFMVVRGS